MISKKVLASLYVVTSVCASLAWGESDAAAKYVAEYNRVSGAYNDIMKSIEKAKNGNEWDEKFHQLQGFMSNPGFDKNSGIALCAHLKSLDHHQLEYVENIIDSEITKMSLKSCRAELLTRINYASKFRKTSFDLDSDISNIRPIAFEERVVDENLKVLSNQGFKDKEVMLTFDDGPTKNVTPNILNALKKAGVKGAFFNTGRMAIANSDMVKRVIAEGHVLGSHSYFHTLMMGRQVNRGKMSYDYFMSEFIGGHMAVYSAAKFIDPFFRFPNGCSNQNMARNVAELGLKNFRWSVDSFDWQFQVSKNPDYEKRRQDILRSFVTQLRGSNNRGIVLMHDIFKQSGEALPLILNYLSDNGFKVVLLKPAHRQVTPNQQFPLVTQAYDYINARGMKLSQVRPATTAEGDPVSPIDYKSPVDFFAMFPQLTYQQHAIDPAASECEYR